MRRHGPLLFVAAVVAALACALSISAPARADLSNPSITGTLAAGQVPFTALAHRSYPGIVAGDNNLFWDNTNKRLGVGTSSPTYPLDVRRSGSGLDVLNIRNTHASGLSTLRIEDDAGSAARTGLGYNNSSDVAYLYRGQDVDFRFAHDHDGDSGASTEAVSEASWFAPTASWDGAFHFGNHGSRILTGTGVPLVQLSPPALASPADMPTTLRVTGAAHTGLPASTEYKALDIQLAQTVTFAAGAQSGATAPKGIKILAPTIAFAGASTSTDASTVYINGAPTAGANATLTTPHALHVDSGDVRLDGGILGFTSTFESGTAATTDATVTTCGSFTPTDNAVTQVTTFVTGRRSTGAEGAGYELGATFRTSAGTVTQIGTTTAISTHEDVAGWAATIDASGGAIRNRVTGAAGSTIAWTCRTSVRTVQ